MFTMTARKLASEIRNRKLGIEELAKAYLERIDRLDGPNGLNTISELNEAALKEARHMDSIKADQRGPMFGLPIFIKDNVDVAGFHTTAGSLALSDNIAKQDAHVVANLRRNGALILGKTKMTELANYTGDDMPGGYSSLGGQVIHAYDSKKDPSGSSSGSAVAMSAGLCAATIGTDTSFSIVGCATENGVAGIKPAHGSLCANGIIPIAKTLDSSGPITRDLQDAILVYSSMRDVALAPIEAKSPASINLAINIFEKNIVSENQLAMYENVLSKLRDDRAKTTEVVHPSTEYEEDIMRYEFRHDIEEYLAGSTASSKTLQELVEFYESDPERMMKYGIRYLREALDLASGKLDDPGYIKAISERKRLSNEIISELSKYDACLMTGPTNIMHFIGLPSLVLKLGMAKDGTPRGMILYGADEQRLLSAALTIEKYCSPVTMPNL